jgi:glycosyltransferase involved in cell wall biosynthesis
VAQPLDGGLVTCVGQLLEHQAAQDIQVTVACPAASEIGLHAERSGVPHIAWDATRSPGRPLLGETRRLTQIVDELVPDVVHLHSSKAGLAGRLAVRGRRPTFFQPNGWSFEAATGVEQRGALAWERFAARWVASIVCVSNDERRRGEEAGIRASWQVVPNGVDLGSYSFADDAERRATRRRLDLEDRPLALCIGRLTRQKGQDVLLDAWPRVLARVPTATLVIVGDGPDREALERRRAPSTVFTGARDDVVDWLAAADVVVLPSRWEGMALTMLEAMARGRSVVATDVAGAPEALAGKAGAVVPRQEPRALGDAIAVRLLDPQRAAQEGAAGRSLVERTHDVRRTTAAVTALYASV